MVRALTIYVCDHCPQVYSEKHKCVLHEQLMHSVAPPTNGHDHDAMAGTSKSGGEDDDVKKEAAALPIFNPMAIFNMGLGDASAPRADGMNLFNMPSTSPPPQINGRPLTPDSDIQRKQQMIECETCGVALQRNSMYRHMKTHTQERFTCAKCPMTFRTQSNVVRHEATVHSEARKYECQFCNYRFTSSDIRNVHEKSHTGQRPHPCQYCAQAFKTSSSLLRHQRAVHLKLRPEVCSLCDTRFGDRNQLRRHYRTVHSMDDEAAKAITPANGSQQRVDNLACDRCGKQFALGRTLVEHRLVCDGVRDADDDPDDSLNLNGHDGKVEDDGAASSPHPEDE